MVKNKFFFEQSLNKKEQDLKPGLFPSPFFQGWQWLQQPRFIESIKDKGRIHSSGVLSGENHQMNISKHHVLQSKVMLRGKLCMGKYRTLFITMHSHVS